MAATIVFRADASAQLGGGHVQRCLTLAQVLRARGWRCGFAVNPGAETVVPGLRDTDGLEVFALECAMDAEAEAMRIHWPQGVDWLVVDHYRRDITLERACRPWARRILAIDDLADRVHDCDALLDQTLDRTADAYAANVPLQCRMLLGSGYALLRPQFAALRDQTLAYRKTEMTVRHVLVAMGATDAVNATEAIIDLLRDADMQLELDIVLSAYAPHLAGVHAKAAMMDPPGRVRTDVKDMAALMMRADIAIGAAGTTSWERCSLGLPSVLIVTADNQRRIAEALHNAGAAYVCGEWDALDPDRLAEAVRWLCADAAARCDMSARAARVCDGRGAERVADYLGEAIAA